MAYRNEFSEGLYAAVEIIIGSEPTIQQIRLNWKMVDAFDACDSSNPLLALTSGSKAEGFTFQTSDFDFMEIDKNVIVLNSNSNLISRSVDIPTVLIMEPDNASPGFTLLRCVKLNNNERLLFSLVQAGKDFYVSSQSTRILSKSYHGPCCSREEFGVELDFAYTLKCPVWPTQANAFIYRSLHHGWPSVEVLTNICTDGCLLVPIGSKEETISKFISMEWRISFSLAEKKLVHSMNQCQFLCYGLLKILLNEVLKPETRDLLCSYFMKTAVFWEISESANNWSASNFFVKFRNAFARLIRWIDSEYCPNFFITEYNMFKGKIYGSQRKELMRNLRILYDEGYQSLLRCTSLKRLLPLTIKIAILQIPYSSVTEDLIIKCAAYDGLDVLTKIIPLQEPLSRTDIIRLKNTFCKTAAMTPTSDDMASAITLRLNSILQMIAVNLQSINGLPVVRRSNRSRCSFIKTSQSILRKTKSFLFLGKMHDAVCSYQNGNYLRTVKIVNYIKHRLRTQSFMYCWSMDNDFITECCQLGISYATIFRTFVVDSYRYKPEISIIELYLESCANKRNKETEELCIPPLVFLNFLLILSYSRLFENENRIRNKILSDLHSLILNDNGYHIRNYYKAISWEILGICQQLCCDFDGAYQSFYNALNDKYNYFRKATLIRITILLFVIWNH